MKIQNTYKTEAIVLRSVDVKEYDRVYTIFSREHGKMCAIGIGIRKPTAKLASGLEPLTKSEIFLVKGRNFDRVRGVIIHKQYQKMRENLDLLCEGKKTARIIEQLSEEGQVSDEIYQLFCEFLEILDELGFGNGEEDFGEKLGEAKLLQLALIWRLVKWSGHEPKLFHCVNCNSRLQDNDRFIFSFPDGVFCDECKDVAGGTSVSVGKDTIKLLRIFLSHDAKTIRKIRCSLSALRQTVLVSKTMLENLVGRRIEL
ncbi:MAG: DNA repair protein RecO [Patescibacteria group bacterium]|nr:DNA repair protein RecO [Patescibacteria group bacterium]